VTVAYAVLLGAAFVASALCGLRWLRVAQREHYLAGSATLFARRWWFGTGPNRLLLLAAALGFVLSVVGLPEAGVVAAAALVAGPFGLGLRGRTSKLDWTRRLRLLALVAGALSLIPTAVALVIGGLGWGAAVVLAAALLSPVVMDAALALTAPIERRLGQPFVVAAEAKLRAVHPDVVAVTGSYGKTTTKGYIAHLVSGTKTVVPSPASFNNRAGLARAVNEHLSPGTEVFVAEMGTYGPGEIADMCAWVRPRIGVITAIGPVHLERMRTEERITAAKAEILDGVEVAVLNVDDAHLVALAEESGKRVVRCSGRDRTADVCVEDGVVWSGGQRLGDLAGCESVAPTNLACAVAVALEVGVPAEAIAARLPTLAGPRHRLSVATGSTGVTILDDTYNANPAGGTAALAALCTHATDGGRRVVVTPGMVELGPRQRELNREFGAEAAQAATDLLIVGNTNRAAILHGAAGGPATVLTVDTRDEAVSWVRDHLGPGDVVLYENDLPDHYP
jgi:UDP-N-acetylmuramoyl-tripeptide--D-alanyl-D-alanine ligase